MDSVYIKCINNKITAYVPLYRDRLKRFYCDSVYSSFMDDVLHLVDGERGHAGTEQRAQPSETLNNTDTEPYHQAADEEVSAESGPLDSKRKRCRACGKKNRKTSMMCQKCKMPICKEHAVITVYCPVCANA
ncbi:hypothetical protein E1301_Tti008435 [Triplophysa tibetana]|uniref:Uncharacterized protein n=1 Tax=Triplophysa tibetana TaxID=1572043 RepID=A0A5A9P497_9TELE|nr:hypothetical protein E1301_Tti008435 [Triplophysa tibetana]